MYGQSTSGELELFDFYGLLSLSFPLGYALTALQRDIPAHFGT